MTGRKFIVVCIASILALAFGAGCTPLPVRPAATFTVPVTSPSAAASPRPLITMERSTPAETRQPVTNLETPDTTLPPGSNVSLISTEAWSPPEHRTRYVLDARLDYARHSLSVEERIEYTNTTSESLTAIPLVVDALRYPHTFDLAGAADALGKPLQAQIKDTTLTLTLAAALLPDESIQLTLNYSLALPDVTRLPQLRPYPLGYTPSQANFGDWYPFIPPYVAGKGWRIHPPATYGEYLAYDVADFDVSIHLEGSLAGVVVAAPSLAEREAQADGEWLRYRHIARRNFAWSASPYYEVITQTVQTEAGHSVLLASYYYPLHAPAGHSLLDAMAQSLPLYSRLFGDYPHPQLSGVQADFLDGMEYDGLFFLSTDFYNWHKDTPDDFLKALAAHETAHQWWMGIVGSDPAQEPWLDEALCTYSEVIFYENEFPEALDWWWNYRVNYYEPQGWVDIRVDEVPGVAGQYRLYRDPVYLRGALFMEELRSLIGDDAFFTALHQYTSRYAYRHADAAGFFEIVRQNTSQDLSLLISQYFQYP